MNVQQTQNHMNFQTTANSSPVAFIVLVGIFSAVFWMYVGWRAMRAHERLAEAAEELARKSVDTPRV
jgi:uncharacterized membrane protein